MHPKNPNIKQTETPPKHTFVTYETKPKTQQKHNMKRSKCIDLQSSSNKKSRESTTKEIRKRKERNKQELTGIAAK